MQQHNTVGQGTPATSLRMTRLIWLALIVGQLVFLGVVVILQLQGALPTTDTDTIRFLFYINCAMLLGAVPIAYIIRMQIYKKNWQGDAVTPGGYFQGNLIFLAILEGQALFSIVVTMVSGEMGITLLPAAIALAIQALNLPSGRPMEAPDAEARFGDDLERPAP